MIVIKNILEKKIVVITPASGVVGFEKLLPDYLKTLRKISYDSEFDVSAIDEKKSFSAGSVKARASQFIEISNKDDVEVVLPFRGGYGSMEIISEIDEFMPEKFSKIFLGYSDITAIHSYLHYKYDIVTYYSDVLNGIHSEEQKDKKIFKIQNFLSGKIPEIIINGMKLINSDVVKQDSIDGKTAGGNLCILSHTMGSFYSQDFRDSIVFLEDIDEQLYKTRRSLVHLINTGNLNKAKAIIFGVFTDENKVRYSESDFLKIINELIKIPVFITDSFGHINNPEIIPLNSQAEINISGDIAKVTIETGL